MTRDTGSARRKARALALRGALVCAAAASLAACAGGPHPGGAGTGGAPTSRYAGYRVGKPYQVNGVWYYPKDQPGYDEIGLASWYGEQFHNHYTADGEVFDMRLPSAAHTTLPLPSLVEVTNLATGRTLVVRVNDRGPFVSGRVIDLSREAAEELGFVAAGLTRVRVRYVGQADAPQRPRQYQALEPRLPTPKAQPSPERLASVAPGPAAQAPPAASIAAPAPSVAPAALAEVDALLADAPPMAVSAAPDSQAAPTGFQVQAGVFASRANAEALAARLAGAGAPDVQPFERNGQTFYRVTVRGLSNADQAAAARGQAAALGAPDARVVGGS